MLPSLLPHTAHKVLMETSFGIIPINSDHHVLLVYDTHGNWGFPKGHPNNSETPRETATRELEEETSLHIVTWVHAPPLVNRYLNQDKEKCVEYFIAFVQGNVQIDHKEITDFVWLSLDQAKHRLTFDSSKDLITIIKKALE